MPDANKMTYFDFYNLFVVSVSIECVSVPFGVGSVEVLLFYVGLNVIYGNT
jgi:hypothetical protein